MRELDSRQILRHGLTELEHPGKLTLFPAFQLTFHNLNVSYELRWTQRIRLLGKLNLERNVILGNPQESSFLAGGLTSADADCLPHCVRSSCGNLRLR